MTVETNGVISGPFYGNGVATRFPRNFSIEDSSHVVVTVDGVAQVGGYTVLDPDLTQADVEFSVAPDDGVEIYFTRNTPILQDTDYSSQGSVSPEQIEADLDYRTRVEQENRRDSARSIKVPLGSEAMTFPASFGNNQWIGTDEEGNVIAGGDASQISSAQQAGADAQAALVTIQELIANLELATPTTFNTVEEMITFDFAGVMPPYLRTFEFSTDSIYGGAQYKLLDVGASPAPGDQTFLSGRKYRLHQETIHPQMFGNKSAINNSGIFQQAMDFSALSDSHLVVPKGLYRFNDTINVRSSNAVLEGRGNGTILEWMDPEGAIFDGQTLTPDTASVASVRIANMLLRMGVAPATTATGARAFTLRRAVSWIFDNVRTENFYIHYDTFGLTRPKWDNCNAYGNTLWPAGVTVPGSCFVSLDGHVLGDGSRRPAANVVMSGTEYAGNFAALDNMENCIYIKDCDGFFPDKSVYLGLAAVAGVRCIPSAPDAVLVNLLMDIFFDGGQSTTANVIEFTEPTAGYMTGTCKNNGVGGEISGAGGSGIRLAIQNMENFDVDAIIKASAAYGINMVRETALNVAGSTFEANVFGDILAPTGAVIRGTSAAQTDRANVIAAAPSITLHPLAETFVLNGANVAINTMLGGWEGREVTLIHKNAGQSFVGGGNIAKAAGPSTANNDVSQWVFHANAWRLKNYQDN